MFRLIKISFLLFFVIALAGYVTVKTLTKRPAFGAKMDAVSLALADQSPQYNGERFENKPPRAASDIFANIKEYFGGQSRRPTAAFPIETPMFNPTPKPGLRAIWFGHATVYAEIDGKRVITDPMLSEHAFPVKLIAPTRYNPSPVDAETLPPIDFVTISHDHFDHLDMPTIQALAARGATFFVGLGIKAHLIKWKVPESKIHELDWWQSVTVGNFTIHCTPARHYSGRKFPDDSTLWSSWVVQGPAHTIYHSGDSGYAPHFKEIGRRFGPINIALIKIGDYGVDPAWRDVHMYPDKSVQAHLDLNADVMLPIHWGTFNLSFHDWFEPINLTVSHARKHQVKLVTPKLGQLVEYGQPSENVEWWKPLEAVGAKN